VANQQAKFLQLDDGAWVIVQPSQKRFSSKSEGEWAICLEGQRKKLRAITAHADLNAWEKKLAAISAGCRKRMPFGQPKPLKKPRRDQTWNQSLRTAFSKLLKQTERMGSGDEWEKCLDSKRSALQKRERFHHHKQATRIA
jgi:hypothetical protein